MYNVRFYRNESIIRLITYNNFEMPFLPPDSLFLGSNDKMMFSKWKEIAKRASSKTEGELMQLIESGKNLIALSDCEEYFGNMH